MVDTVAPILKSKSPADNSVGVSVSTNIVLTFSEIVKAGATGTIRIYESNGTLVQTISTRDTSQVTFGLYSYQVKINPKVDLAPGKSYYILISPGAIEDRAGNDYTGISSPTAFNFTTAGAAVDTTPPTLSSTSPADNATGVAVGANLVLTFNESVKAGSGNIEIHKVSDGSIAMTIAVTDTSQVTFSGSQMTINPTSNLASGTAYYVVFGSGVVRDLANNAFAGISSTTAFNFTTVDTTAPTLVTTSPLDDATLVSPSANLVLTFSEAVKAGSGNIEIHKVSDGSIVMSIAVTDTSQVTFSGSQMTINPTSNLAQETAYYVTFGSGVVRDLANNAFAGISSATTFNFTTKETVPPLLVETSPANWEMGVNVGANLVLTFNEPVKAGSGNIVITNAHGSDVLYISVTDTSQVTVSGNQVTINPSSDLAESGLYYVTMGPGVIRDLANNSFYGLYQTWDFHFWTVDPTPPELVDTSPADDATGVAPGSNFILMFNEAVKRGTGNIEIRNASDDSIALSIDITDTSQVDVGGSWVTIDPSSDLVQGASYYITMGSGVVLDWADNPFAGISSPTTFNFTIAPDVTAPLLVSNLPANEATKVDIGANLVLTFDEAVAAGSGNIEIRNASDGSIAKLIAVTDASQVSFSGNQLTINPSSSLADGASYYITFGSGVVRDLASNPFAGIFSPSDFTFSTAPHLILGTPANETLYGEENRNDMLQGLPGVDTLIGKTGDDTYVIKNYEGGQTSVLFYALDGEYVESYLPEEDDLFFNVYDFSGDGDVDHLQILYDGWLIFGFSTTQLGTNLVAGTYSDADLDLFASVGHPGLYLRQGFYADFPYGYAYDSGSFTIIEAVFDYSNPAAPALVSFSATFEMYSSTGGPTIFGRVNYNYAAAGAAALDTVVENPDEGNDTVVAGVSYTLPANVENLTLTGYQDLSGTGNALDNVITGNGAPNIIDGASGADKMIGGWGDDTYVVDNVSDTIVEKEEQGIDTVLSSVTYTLDANVENLTLTGSANINGNGNELGNTFTGNPGANVFSGGGGDDTYFLNNAADSVVENPDEGSDTVFASFSKTLEANVENLNLTGTGNVNGTGNEVNNVLLGTYEAAPGTGQNVLSGGDGNDNLNGLSGMDTLIGGLGDDTYIIDNYEGGATSFLYYWPPELIGNLPVVVSYLPSVNDVDVVLQDLTGDGLVDHLAIGFEYYENGHYNYGWVIVSTNELDQNLISGMTYTDARPIGTADHAGFQVYGSINNYSSFTITHLDIDYSDPNNPVLESLSLTFESRDYYPDWPAMYGTVNYQYAAAGPVTLDTIVEDLNAGIDTVESVVSYTLGDNLENLWLRGGITGIGNDLDNVISADGFDVDNYLDGKAGADTMIGSYGDDTYIVDNIGDKAIEDQDWSFAGTDTVYSSVTFSLGVYIEKLILTGAANIDGTGNAKGNFLTGNLGNNVLDGGGGDDLITGGGGNDTFKIFAGAGNDAIVDFSAGAGVGDVVNLDGFTLGSFSAVQAAMTQNGSDVVLNLGNGQTLTFWDVQKTSFTSNDFTFTNVQGPTAPDPFTLPVSGAYTSTISGGWGNDTLNGTSANNKIDGGGGADTMIGGLGDDTYVVNQSTDIVVENAGEGIDTVISTASSYTLAANVENLTLSGLINHIANGNGLDNLITAGSKADTINAGAGNDIIKAGIGASTLTGGAGTDMFVFSLLGAKNLITDFHDGEDLLDLRPLLSGYAGGDPVGDGVIALTTVAGGVLVSVDPTMSGILKPLVELTGVSVGDLGIGSDILWN